MAELSKIRVENIDYDIKDATARTTKQNITDNTLTTTSKTVPGAINELAGKFPVTVNNMSSAGQLADKIPVSNGAGGVTWQDVPAIGGKADKVANATAGDFAGLDANGNLTDSGKNVSDFATAEQGALADTAVQQSAIQQTTGTSTTDIMSQKAVTDELANKANVDGYYAQMTVGNAEQLIATVGVIDKVPYNFRTAGGSADIGNRLNDKIVGGTIVWNQLVNFDWISSQTFYGVTLTKNNDNSITLNGITTQDNCYFNIGFTPGVQRVKPGHVVLYNIEQSTDEKINFYILSQTASFYSPTKNNRIVKIPSSNEALFFRLTIPTAGTAVIETIRIKAHDLTQMFGSTIADYIYSLEQATAGAGVEWFKNLFPKPYYAYNAGELMSVCTNAHITRGFNAWDEEWELGSISTADGHKLSSNSQIRSKNFNKAFPNLTYCIRNRANVPLYIFWYDINYGFISAISSIAPAFKTVISPDNAHYFKVKEGNDSISSATYNHDICINLSWSGYRNGEYEPYVEHNYPLSSVELRGIPRLDSANNLYYDGDTYEKDGTVTRKYGIVDLGTLDWQYSSNGHFNAPVVGITRYEIQNYREANILCDKYQTTSIDTVYGKTSDKVICKGNTGYWGNNKVAVYDTSYTDATAFKTAMSGVYLIYELGTPTTETANPFADPQIVDDFGTEKYIDALATAETNPRDVAIPVGHETFYQANLRDKLQNLPTSANADGLYLIKQTGNKQELIAYTPESELPTIQTEGTYALKSVNGVLTWVAE